MDIKLYIEKELRDSGVAILPPDDVISWLKKLNDIGLKADTIIFDPWYFNREEYIAEGTYTPYQSSRKNQLSYVDYKKFIKEILLHGSHISDHIFIWEFPEIAASFLPLLPEAWKLSAWLTWFYKNNPRKSASWRPSQNACLHISKQDAVFYPENFEKNQPYDVIEADLIGAQNNYRYRGEKNVEVYKQLILMTTNENGLVIDLMCGAGTTADAARSLGRKSIISDLNQEALSLSKERLSLNT